MNLMWIDWCIVIVVPAIFVVVAYRTNKYSRSVTDFLAANRLAGRYLLTMSEGMVVLAAGACVATWQLNYRTGFGAYWWTTLSLPFALFLTLIGWVIYRYRQTRAFTMAQYFEMRYSAKFRVLAGLICWTSGVLNYGIFPAITAEFFIYFCGLPSHVSILGFPLSTYAIMVILLMVMSLYFTFIGGQVSIIVTDFLQGLFTNSVLLIMLVVLLTLFPLKEVFDGLQIAAPGKSMVDPFDANEVEGFNPMYFIIGISLMIFNRLAWQGGQAYFCSAKSPHEAKMATVLGGFRFLFFNYALMIVPLVAYMIMHHPNYADKAAVVTEKLSHIDNAQVRDQMITPLTMGTYMPSGLMGAFAAVIIAGFVASNASSLHSWGTIFVQDVILPFRKKPWDTKRHFLFLRISILVVALFAILWSLLIPQFMDIWMFFALTGAIWLGGAGVVIVGGLYTSWGNTRGAYAALISGSTVASTGFLLIYLKIGWVINCKYLTGQWMYFWATVIALLMYICFSLLGKRHEFNLDKMLHRGKYKADSDSSEGNSSVTGMKWTWRVALGITKEFTRGDKLIYAISIGQTILFLLWFAVLTLTDVFIGMTAAQWAYCHRIFFGFWIAASFVIAGWLGIGSIVEGIQFFKDLKVSNRDFSDNGTVVAQDSPIPVQTMKRESGILSSHNVILSESKNSEQL